MFIQAIDVFFNVIEWLIFIRILLSWIPMFGYSNPLGRLIYNLTEPILGPCRSMLEKSPLGGGMMLDFSPIIALILMEIFPAYCDKAPEWVLVKQLLMGLVLLF